jgi:hypothetical protein
MRSGLWTHALSLICTQAGGTREGISIFCLSVSLLPINAHVLKIGTSVLLLKGNKTAPFLGSVTDSIGHFFFNDYKGLLP